MPHEQSEQFSLKSIKEINILAKIMNPRQFINGSLTSTWLLIRKWKYYVHGDSDDDWYLRVH